MTRPGGRSGSCGPGWSTPTRARSIADLPDLIESLQVACRQANEAITKRYFAYSAPVAWAQEG